MAGVDFDAFTTFGEYLRYLRRRAGLTQRELGLAVGYSDVQIARLEKNQRSPDATLVRARFIEALDLQHHPDLAARLVELAIAARSATGAGRPHDVVTQPASRRTNLPVQLTRFIGREVEKARVEGLLAENRLVTLTGSGGVGKTRLAAEAGRAVLDAHAYVDGVWLVDLAPLADEALVARLAAGVFKLPDEPGRTAAQTLVTHLADKQALLVLDNCEHVIAACAGLVEELLRGCAGLRVLATSREPLRVPGEVAWRVPPLPVDEAEQLFAERASAVRPGFAVTAENAERVAWICRRLDGIPLAIELAAARVSGLGVAEIAARLDDRIALLTGGSRTALPRHQTLRAALDWSYALLSDAERGLLARLAVFAGGWTAEAAEAVCAEEAPAPDRRLRISDVLPLLLSLVDKSLVVADPGGRADAESQAAGTRYHMLETVRQYAAEKLAEAEPAEAAQTRSRHLDYYLAMAEQTVFGLRQAKEGEKIPVTDRVERELDNCRAALAFSLAAPVEDERGLSLTNALESMWQRRGYVSEGREWVAKALAKWTNPTPARAGVLSDAGLMAFSHGDYAAAHAYLTESINLARVIDDPFDLADALLRFSIVNIAQVSNASIAPGVLEQIEVYIQEALHIARVQGFQPLIGYAVDLLSGYALWQARLGDARRLREEGLASQRASGHLAGVSYSLGSLAVCDMAAQDWDAARARWEEVNAIAGQIHKLGYRGWALLGLARVAREQGHYAQAIRLLEECREINQTLDVGQDPQNRGINAVDFLVESGRTVQLQGDTARAAALLREAMDVSRDTGNRFGLARSLNFLAALVLDQGDLAEASGYCRESLQLSADLGSPFNAAVGLAGLAEVAWRRNEAERAARLCGAAAALGDMHRLVLADFGRLYLPSDWLEYDRTMQAMRARLDDPAFAAAWAEGEHMTVQQVVAG